MRIRPFEPRDTDAVVALWEACGLTRPWNDPRADIARKLRVQPELFLVGEADAPEADAIAEADAPAEADTRGEADAPEADASAEPATADEAAPVIATVMAGYDGHRGWLYYFAVAPARQGAGHGRELLTEVERRLTELGCPKVQLQVRPENHAVLGFYERLGYEPYDSGSTGKRLVRDGTG